MLPVRVKYFLLLTLSALFFTVVLFVCMPSDKHLEGNIGAKNDWTVTTRKLPSLLLSSSTTGRWHLDNGSIREVRFSDDPDDPIHEYTTNNLFQSNSNNSNNFHNKDKIYPTNQRDSFNKTETDKCMLNSTKHLICEESERNKHDCKDADSDNFCFIWEPRKFSDRPKETEYEGVISLSSFVNPFTEPTTLFLRIIAQRSLSFFAKTFVISFHAIVPELSTTKSKKTWRAFGYGGGNTQELRKVLDDNATDDNKNLLELFLSSTINESSSLKLFAEVCRAQEILQKNHTTSTTLLETYTQSNIHPYNDINRFKAKKELTAFVNDNNNHQENSYTTNVDDSNFSEEYSSARHLIREIYNRSINQSSTNDDTNNIINKEYLEETDITSKNAVSPYTFKKTCFWLAEFTFEEHNRSVHGRAWSSCGDRLSFSSSMEVYEHLINGVSNGSIILIVVWCLPLIFGMYSQVNWIHNSRGRTLRMSLAQVYLNLYWISFNFGLLSILWLRSPSSCKALELLFCAVTISLAINTQLIQLIHKESVPLTNEDEGTSTSFLMFFLLTIVSVIGIESVFLLEHVITHWMFIITVSTMFWLPQLAHNFMMDSWAGLTTPYIISSVSFITMPLIFSSLLMLEPWKNDAKSKRAFVYGILIIAAETAFLIVFNVTNGRHLLPHWMVPWRHIYKTTVEKQRAAISENGMCPICRSSLEQGWDGNDELWQTPCHHLFHKSCLERWMIERMECPLCRTLLPEPEENRFTDNIEVQT